MNNAVDWHWQTKNITKLNYWPYLHNSSDDEESEIEDGYYAELDSDVGDSTADEEDDLYTWESEKKKQQKA